MNVDQKLADILRTQQELREQQQQLLNFDRGASGGGAGGGGSAVEGRVNKIEGDLSAFRLDTTKAFGEIKANLAAIEERSKHLPTRWDSFLMIGGVVSLVGGALALIVRFVP